MTRELSTDTMEIANLDNQVSHTGRPFCWELPQIRSLIRRNPTISLP